MGRHVVIINGTGGVGKDTLIYGFKTIVGYTAKSISMVDRVKKAAQYLGWDGSSKTDEDRKALAELKDFSDKYWTTPIDSVIKKYGYWRDNDRSSNWLFIIARDPKDIAKLVELIPDVKTVLITRDGIESHGNHADDEVNNYQYDLVFENNKDIQSSSMDFAHVLHDLCDEEYNTAMNEYDKRNIIKEIKNGY